LVDSKAASKADRKFAISPAVIVILLAVIAGLGAFLWLNNAPPPVAPPKPKLTQQARDYLPNLKLSDVEPQTSESYIQSSLFEIMGKITNAGSKTVAGVLVTCVFRSYDGHEIKREVVSVANASSGVLTPHSTKPFRLAFDDIPDTWNHQMPDFVIAQISFQ
jgi:hypothetical protein